MAVPSPSLNFIADWMESVGLIQADLVNRLGWSKAKASAVWNRDQRVNEDILRDVAPLVNAEPHELLMPPKRAHSLRQIEAIFNQAKEAAKEPDPSGETPPKIATIRRRNVG